MRNLQSYSFGKLWQSQMKKLLQAVMCSVTLELFDIIQNQGLWDQMSRKRKILLRCVVPMSTAQFKIICLDAPVLMLYIPLMWKSNGKNFSSKISSSTLANNIYNDHYFEGFFSYQFFFLTIHIWYFLIFITSLRISYNVFWAYSPLITPISVTLLPTHPIAYFKNSSRVWAIHMLFSHHLFIGLVV